MTSTSDFLELDFLAVETAKSGDAICLRYSIDGESTVHVVDGGFTDMGEKIVDHLTAHYCNPVHIEHVVLTHPDGDHALGLKYVLENCSVGNLWMNRPWLYADEIISEFTTYNSVDALKSKLKKVYCHTAALEQIADDAAIPVREAFQGAQIGIFHVLAPSRERYLKLVVESDKTPVSVVVEETLAEKIARAGAAIAKAAGKLINALWGEEVFSTEPTSSENEMSIVQFANFEGTTFLLTGDAGRDALTEVVEYAPTAGIGLPGIKKFQVPHHGSRRNVSSELLDALLGPKVTQTSSRTFEAYISSAKADPDHPRNSVVRSMYHRGGDVFATEGRSLVTGVRRKKRDGWTTASATPYPEEQEE